MLKDIALSPFHQDTNGAIVEDVYYAPTLAWHSALTAVREDGKSFYAKVVVQDKDKGDLVAIWAAFNNALISLQAYAEQS